MFSSIANGNEIIGEKQKSQERVKMFLLIVMGNKIIGGNGYRGRRNQAKGRDLQQATACPIIWPQKKERLAS